MPLACRHLNRQAGGRLPGLGDRAAQGGGRAACRATGRGPLVQDTDEQYSLPDPPRFRFSDNGALPW